MESPLFPPGQRRRAGFSLVELLVVMAIMAILLTLGGPSILGVFKGSALNQGGEMVQDALNSYRQVALANNYPVEVRFYSYADPSIPSDNGTSHYHAIQGFALTSSQVTGGNITYTRVPISKPLRLPASVIIDSGKSLSQLIFTCSSGAGGNAPGRASATSSDTPLPGVGRTYTYTYFQFKADGSTNFSVGGNGAWIYYLTVHASSSGDPSTVAKNPNYYTVQVDPLNGRLYTYRP